MSVILPAFQQITSNILEAINNLSFMKRYTSLGTKMELKAETKDALKRNAKMLTGVTENNTKLSKHVHEFVHWYKENISTKTSAAKNCILKATIISLWPPYGLALPKESKYFDVGFILFHQSRIIDNSFALQTSGRIKIRSKKVSKHGIYNTKRSWPKPFQAGTQILVRIALPLNECSDRWRQQYKRDKKFGKEITLSDFIHYKAVKVWNFVDQDSNYIPQDEPSLRQRFVKFDQMQQLYIQWSINSVFCLEQLLGFPSRKLIVQILTNDPSCVTLSSMLSKCELYPNVPTKNTAKKIKMSKSKEVVLNTLPSMSLENDGIDINTGNYFKSDNPIWTELEPVEDKNDNNNIKEDSGILNLDDYISQRL